SDRVEGVEDAMTSGRESAGTSAMEKLEAFYKTLSDDEQQVISEMVRASLHQAAEQFAGADVGGYSGIPSFVNGLTGQTAPSLVSGLRLPGASSAHRIPACASSGLTLLKRGSA